MKKGKVINIRNGKAIRLEDLTKGNTLLRASREELIINVEEEEKRYFLKTIAKEGVCGTVISARTYAALRQDGIVTLASLEKKDYTNYGKNKSGYSRYNKMLKKAGIFDDLSKR